MVEKLEVLKNLRIVYLEKENELRSILIEVLNQVCHDVIAVENRQEFLNLFKQYENSGKQINLIISNLNSNNVDELDAIEEIKKTNKDIPFVVFISQKDLELFFRILKLGVNNLITKPIDAEDFLDKLYQAYLPLHQKNAIANKNKEIERLNEKISTLSQENYKNLVSKDADLFSLDEHLDDNSLIDLNFLENSIDS